MRIVIQRVQRASVTINEEIKSKIEAGMLILVGIEEADNEQDVDWLVRKTIGLRIFDDENHVMNCDIKSIDGEILLYNLFCKQLSEALGKEVGTGEFGADMKVELINDGPVTICMDSKNKE